jgi:hypothetical protein
MIGEPRSASFCNARMELTNNKGAYAYSGWGTIENVQAEFITYRDTEGWLRTIPRENFRVISITHHRRLWYFKKRKVHEPVNK